MVRASTILSQGDTLGGFRIVRVIGFGGMAVVYRAEQLSLGRMVALKVLSPQLSGDADFRERFRREGRHVAALDHPNIVPIYDSGESDGRLYLAMRLIEGTTLGERMQTRGLSAEDTIDILRPIARALDVAHDARLVHRDVKPQNILLTTDGHPYLADFGVAKGPQTQGLTATGGFVGSLNYAAPEQILGRPTTAAGDVYALTAVLYQCLTGQVPYPRETDAGVIHAHLNDPPPALAGGDPVECALSDVIACGMAKDPSDRYARAGTLMDVATATLDELPPPRRHGIPAFQTGARDAGGAETQGPPGTNPGAQPAANLEIPPPAANAEVAPSAEPVNEQTEVLHGDGQLVGRDRPDSTTADRRRAPAATDSTESPRPMRRRWLLAGIALATIAAAVTAAAALSGSSGPSVRTATSGLLSLTYPTPWKSAATTVAADTRLLASPIALQNRGATLAAGRLIESASVPGGVPPQLAALLHAPRARGSSRVGGFTAEQYDWGSATGAETIALVLPTRAADLAIVCQGSAGAIASCLTVAETLKVEGTTIVPPGPNVAMGHALIRDLMPVSVGRTSLNGLTNPDLTARAATAQHVELLEIMAASTLAALNVPARNAGATSAITTALRDDARAWGQLASAARTGHRAAYLRASSTIATTAQDLKAAAQALRTQGFSVPAISTPTLPGLPVDLGRALVRDLTPVSVARTSLAGLTAADLAARAATARHVELLDTAAASALAALRVPVRNRHTVAAMAAALRTDARAWGQLASAATTDQRAAYLHANGAITAAGQYIQAASQALHAQGFSLPALTIATLPGLPPGPVTTTVTPGGTTSSGIQAGSTSGSGSGGNGSIPGGSGSTQHPCPPAACYLSPG